MGSTEKVRLHQIIKVDYRRKVRSAIHRNFCDNVPYKMNFYDIFSGQIIDQIWNQVYDAIRENQSGDK